MSLTPEQQREKIDDLIWSDWRTMHDLSDALAPVVQEMLAEAWDQGRDMCVDEFGEAALTLPDNPYRSTT